MASPDLSPELRDFITPGQEKDISFVINEPRSIWRERMEQYLRARNIALRATIELWSIEAIKKSVTANLGISFLPRFAVEGELCEGTLVELPVSVAQDKIAVICVRHRNRQCSAAMTLFEELLSSAW